MDHSESSAERIEQLELKLMDLEMSLQQINDVVLKHYHEIEALQQANKVLEMRLANSMDANGALPSVKDELPPHY